MMFLLMCCKRLRVELIIQNTRSECYKTVAHAAKQFWRFYRARWDDGKNSDIFEAHNLTYNYEVLFQFTILSGALTSSSNSERRVDQGRS